MEFLDYYRENLHYIRHLAREFALEFPKIAKRLELSEFECEDPYVERLLEGTAFLAARVEQKIESGFPRLLESMLSTISPELLAPIPSMAIVQMDIDYRSEKLQKSPYLSENIKLNCLISNIDTPCTYTIYDNMSLTLFQLTEAEYCVKNLEQFSFAEDDIQAAIRLKFACQLNREIKDYSCDELNIFLNLPEEQASMLQEQILIDCVTVYGGYNGNYSEISNLQIDIPLLRKKRSKIKHNPIEGLEVLQLFYNYPAALKFISVQNLQNFIDSIESDNFEIVFALNKRVNTFSNLLKTQHLLLNCATLINIFKKSSNRTIMSGEYEYHVIPDRTNMQDYEVYRVLSVDFFNEHNETLFTAYNCYDQNGKSGRNNSDFFTAHRRGKVVNQQRCGRTSYNGTELFLSFLGSNWQQKQLDIRQFSAKLVCTNRDLPLLLNSDSHIEISNDENVVGASFVTTASKPQKALISSGQAEDWEKISHLSFNLSSSLWLNNQLSLENLKKLLQSYYNRNELEVKRLLEGILSIKSRPKMFRFSSKGCIFYENGWEIELSLNEENFEGIGYFIFGRVIAILLQSYVPLNSAMELILHSDKRKCIAKWRI